jgi:hypothetical protein
MKGTSGAVKRVFLRGTTRRAALGRPNGPSRAPTHDTAGRRQEVSRAPTGRGKSSSRERSRRCSWTALDVLPCPPEVRLASSRGVNSAEGGATRRGDEPRQRASRLEPSERETARRVVGDRRALRYVLGIHLDCRSLRGMSGPRPNRRKSVTSGSSGDRASGAPQTGIYDVPSLCR